MSEMESLFVRFFGEYPIVKALDFLLDNRLTDYSRKEIAEGAGIALSTLLDFWPRLEAAEMVMKTREVGIATMYILNTKSPLVQDLIDFDERLVEAAVPKAEAQPVAVRQRRKR